MNELRIGDLLKCKQSFTFKVNGRVVNLEKDYCYTVSWLDEHYCYFDGIKLRLRREELAIAFESIPIIPEYYLRSSKKWY